ncbi:MAG: hypothetical protein HY721_25130 [Planctomycetes bacterium]|nr:hypothetical protein [Planctomycetota bacterium]
MHATLLLPLLLCLALSAPAEPTQPPEHFANPWATVGLKDYSSGTRISPANELLLGGGRRVRLRFGAELRPLGRGPMKTLLEGWLPVVVIEARDGAVAYTFKVWATPLPSVKDWRAAFDGPVEGEDYLNWVAVEAADGGAVPAAAGFSAEATASGGGGEARRLASFAWRLAPGGKERVVLRIPFEPSDAPEAKDTFAGEDAALWLERTVAFWRGMLASGARLEVPEEKPMACLRASHVNQLIGSDAGEVRGGEGFYDEFYIRDGAYQVMHLEEAGFLEAARRAMPYFLRCQRPDGRFESQAGQLDANGQALWALWQFHLVTGDRAWLAQVYPAMRRAVEWIRGARRQAPAGSPFAGLLPAALADGELLWEGKNHIVGYDLWNLRGLLCAAEAARTLGEKADAEALAAEARDYRASIDAAWKRTGLPHLPPSWEGEGTHWGNTETLWPTAVFEVADPRVAAMVKEARERFGGGFLEGTIRWCPGRVAAIHPYLSSYTTLASLTLGEHETVVEEIYSYLLHSTAANGFPEGIYHKRRFAWGDTVPHLTGAAQCANLLRHALVHEEGSELHLLKAAPDGWLAPGKRIDVERAPTHFGPLSLAVEGRERGIEVRLEPPRRSPPSRIVLHVPASRRPEAVPAGVDLVVRSDQKQRWSFEEVLKLHGAAPAAWPIPGLVPLPLAEPLADARCVRLDLATAANAHPFEAPFGVPTPGKYLFTGLNTGHLRAGGVPFEVIDPARNRGRGILVLQGHGGSSGFPREIGVPVGATGKRLYLLGNVHGWSPEDEGAGEWGALAEHVIQYADGSEQVVPLIAGRTSDDWASPPQACEAYLGPCGDPWHLNVLGVELRPVRVERLVFRDLGTPSAPVLVAATMELAP